MVTPLAILSAGTEEQEKRYIEVVSSGKKIISFWLSERNTGYYNLGMEATAILEKDHYAAKVLEIYEGTKDIQKMTISHQILGVT